MKKVLPVILLSLFVLPLVAFAAADPTVVICNILQRIKVIIAAIGFGIAIIMLIWGGILYMTAGGDDEKAKKAKTLIVNAIIGIAIIFAAVFILTVIQGFLENTPGFGPIFGNPCGTY